MRPSFNSFRPQARPHRPQQQHHQQQNNGYPNHHQHNGYQNPMNSQMMSNPMMGHMNNQMPMPNMPIHPQFFNNLPNMPQQQQQQLHQFAMPNQFNQLIPNLLGTLLANNNLITRNYKKVATGLNESDADNKAKENKRSYALVYTSKEIQQWCETRRKNFPTKLNVEKKLKKSVSGRIFNWNCCCCSNSDSYSKMCILISSWQEVTLTRVP